MTNEHPFPLKSGSVALDVTFASFNFGARIFDALNPPWRTLARYSLVASAPFHGLLLFVFGMMMRESRITYVPVNFSPFRVLNVTVFEPCC